jgi:lysylphosphatidylglycerol synthetase-like protein (DUF2156 family)
MAPVDLLLARHVYTLIAVWVLVYGLDYLLTIVGARLHTQGASQHLLYEGSYELTPAFQVDIDRQRLVSPRFLFYVLLSCLLIYLFWYADVVVLGSSGLFALLAGALFLREAAVLMRHFRTIALFEMLKGGRGMDGLVTYRRWLSLRLSGAELLITALLFFVLFLLFGSYFLLGGVLGNLVTGLQHLWWSRKEDLRDRRRSA